MTKYRVKEVSESVEISEELPKRNYRAVKPQKNNNLEYHGNITTQRKEAYTSYQECRGAAEEESVLWKAEQTSDQLSRRIATFATAVAAAAPYFVSCVIPSFSPTPPHRARFQSRFDGSEQ